MRSRALHFVRSIFLGCRLMWQELVVTFAMLVTLVAVASAGVYHFEKTAQPHVFSSYWDTLYWGMHTITTVGYGDLAPVTWQGRLISSVYALVGVGFLLLLVGVIASAYVHEANRQEIPRGCPHCGKPLEREPDDPERNALHL